MVLGRPHPTSSKSYLLWPLQGTVPPLCPSCIIDFSLSTNFPREALRYPPYLSNNAGAQVALN